MKHQKAAACIRNSQANHMHQIIECFSDPTKSILHRRVWNHLRNIANTNHQLPVAQTKRLASKHTCILPHFLETMQFVILFTIFAFTLLPYFCVPSRNQTKHRKNMMFLMIRDRRLRQYFHETWQKWHISERFEQKHKHFANTEDSLITIITFTKNESHVTKMRSTSITWTIFTTWNP
jgi:hypothetical protein